MQSLNVTPGVPLTPAAKVSNFTDQPTADGQPNYAISGVTRTSAGAALGSCVVLLYNAATYAFEQVSNSDSTGNYLFYVASTKTFFVTAYKAGSPDVTGGTLNTLTGT